MPDYQPLDLTPNYNANRGVYDSIGDPPLGSQVFYGLPFQIGDGTGESDCFIGFGSEVGCPSEPVEIPVGQAAVNVVFAHAVIRSEIEAGGPIALPVATYRFVWDDGQAESVTIRERFEIGYMPPSLGAVSLSLRPGREAVDLRPVGRRLERCGPPADGGRTGMATRLLSLGLAQSTSRPKNPLD